MGQPETEKAMTTKKTTNRAPRSPKAVKPAKEKPQGNLKPGSRAKLGFLARRAFEFQIAQGFIDRTTDFEEWRHDQVMQAVRRPGISACDGIHFRRLKGHFEMLAGQDAAAFKSYTSTGKVKDHGPAHDTHEEREKWFALMRADIDQHLALGNTPELQVPSMELECWMAIRDAGGPIRHPYAVDIAMDVFGVPTMQFEDLVKRLGADQLKLLHHTIRNRITAKEGRGDSKARNKSQRSPAAKAARQDREDPGTIWPR